MRGNELIKLINDFYLSRPLKVNYSKDFVKRELLENTGLRGLIFRGATSFIIEHGKPPSLSKLGEYIGKSIEAISRQLSRDKILNDFVRKKEVTSKGRERVYLVPRSWRFECSDGILEYTEDNMFHNVRLLKVLSSVLEDTYTVAPPYFVANIMYKLDISPDVLGPALGYSTGRPILNALKGIYGKCIEDKREVECLSKALKLIGSGRIKHIERQELEELRSRLEIYRRALAREELWPRLPDVELEVKKEFMEWFKDEDAEISRSIILGDEEDKVWDPEIWKALARNLLEMVNYSLSVYDYFKDENMDIVQVALAVSTIAGTLYRKLAKFFHISKEPSPLKMSGDDAAWSLIDKIDEVFDEYAVLFRLSMAISKEIPVYALIKSFPELSGLRKASWITRLIGLHKYWRPVSPIYHKYELYTTPNIRDPKRGGILDFWLTQPSGYPYMYGSGSYELRAKIEFRGRIKDIEYYTIGELMNILTLAMAGLAYKRSLGPKAYPLPTSAWNRVLSKIAEEAEKKGLKIEAEAIPRGFNCRSLLDEVLLDVSFSINLANFKLYVSALSQGYVAVFDTLSAARLVSWGATIAPQQIFPRKVTHDIDSFMSREVAKVLAGLAFLYKGGNTLSLLEEVKGDSIALYSLKFKQYK